MTPFPKTQIFITEINYLREKHDSFSKNTNIYHRNKLFDTKTSTFFPKIKLFKMT